MRKDDTERFNRLQEVLGYKFKDESILKNALTHSSYCNDMKLKNIRIQSNERIEFLGDSILSLITSTYIYNRLKKYDENRLSKVRAAVVCEESLYKLAKKLNLGMYLYLSRGEDRNKGRERKSILADTFEAVLGAIYLDGGFDSAQEFLCKYIEPIVNNIINDGSAEDYKTILKQTIQHKNSNGILEYRVVGETGPEHDKYFEIHAFLNNTLIGKGISNTKRKAEQIAAKDALRLFGRKF